MRRVVVYLAVGVLAAASVMPPKAVSAQEPEQEETPALLGNRDLTPYVVGLGAIMGVIAFNIAAPPIVGWAGVVGRSFSNVVAVTRMAGQRAMVGLARTVPAVEAAAGGAAAVEAPAAEVVAAETAATPARPIVPPLTQTMLAQAQIGGAAAAAAGAVVAHTLYRLVGGRANPSE